MVYFFCCNSKIQHSLLSMLECAAQIWTSHSHEYDTCMTWHETCEILVESLWIVVVSTAKFLLKFSWTPARSKNSVLQTSSLQAPFRQARPPPLVAAIWESHRCKFLKPICPEVGWNSPKPKLSAEYHFNGGGKEYYEQHCHESVAMEVWILEIFFRGGWVPMMVFKKIS